MTEPQLPRITTWPFLLGDLLFVGIAAALVLNTAGPFGLWQSVVCIISIGAGAWLAVVPYLAEYRAAVKLAEAAHLANTVEQVKGIGEASRQVASASAQLQSALDQSAKTVAAAGGIADRMTAEVKAFTEFMAQANDREKAALKLDAEKLRRNEAEWVQVVARMLDHTFALHQAAARAGQPGVADQIGRFQLACLDAARRVGVAAFAVKPGEPFKPEAHQLVDAKTAVSPGALVAETLAPGFTFQGQLIRPALVRLQEAPSAPAADETPSLPDAPVGQATLAGLDS
jgi:molecular chaperone GrpE (heat shock protein)